MAFGITRPGFPDRPVQSQGRAAPGPKGWPLIGVAPHLKADAPNYLLWCARTHGPVVSMRVGHLRCHLTAHPEAIDRVLRKNEGNYDKLKFVEKLKPLLGEGVATSNGERWAASRKIVQAMLTARRVDTLLPEMDAEITAAADQWQAESDLRDPGQASCALTLRVLARSMFGHLDRERVEAVVASIDHLQRHLRDRIWSNIPFSEYLPTSANRDFEWHRQRVLDAVEDLIARHRSGKISDSSFIAVLANATDDTTGEPMTDQQIRDEIMTVFLAGHETTGNTLGWAFHLLADHPHVQAKMRQEILETIPPDHTPSMQDLKNLRYTKAVLEEVMRLYPSAFWFARTALDDDTVMGYRIRKGDTIFVSQYVTQRLAEYWEDPDSFRPERFLEGNAGHRFAKLPFGGGPRTCPGSHFAMAEMSIVLARVLARVHVRQTGAGRVQQDALVTLRPQNGSCVRMEPLTRTVHVEHQEPGEHGLVDAALRLRKRVFVDVKGWPVNTDEQGREHDQFDTRHTRHIVTLDQGRVVAAARAMPLDQPSLLMDVFPWLIQGDRDAYKTRDYWEGARLVADPELSAHDSRRYLAKLLYDTISTFHDEGVEALLTVSDPVMERVLKRVGANPQRLGPVKRDEHGFPVLALYLPCTETTLAKLAGHAERDAAGESDPAVAA